jgi:hypothetical protein
MKASPARAERRLAAGAPAAQSIRDARSRQIIDALGQLLDGTTDEQRRTFAQLRRALNEGRRGIRRLFADE